MFWEKAATMELNAGHIYVYIYIYKWADALVPPTPLKMLDKAWQVGLCRTKAAHNS